MPGMSHKADGPPPLPPPPPPPPPPPGAQQSPLPVHVRRDDGDATSSSSPPSSAAAPASPPFPLPKLRLHLDDLAHAGTSVFLSAVDASTVLASSTQSVLRTLYGTPPPPPPPPPTPGSSSSSNNSSSSSSSSSDDDTAPPPPTRSVTLILRDMGGVAYTTGTDLDADHKEIHLSLRHVGAQQSAGAGARDNNNNNNNNNNSSPGDRGRGRGRGRDLEAARREITGVLVHELVHCFQHDGGGTCPGGLVEGVADFVRLRCGLAAAHWDARPDRSPAARWDAGYERTAFFLDYLERRFGPGTVRRLNARLAPAPASAAPPYDEAVFWPALLGPGQAVARLWQDYRDEALGPSPPDGGEGDGEGENGEGREGEGKKKEKEKERTRARAQTHQPQA